MKRDMDLIRELMLKLEALPMPTAGMVVVDATKVGVEGYTAEQIDYHLSLLEQARFIHAGGLDMGMSGPGFGPGVDCCSLTWAGHDFLDATRSPDVMGPDPAGRIGRRRTSCWCSRQRRISKTGSRGSSVASTDLVVPNGATIPALVTSAGARAGVRFVEFFASAIRNPHTRRVYARAVGDFLA